MSSEKSSVCYNSIKLRGSHWLFGGCGLQCLLQDSQGRMVLFCLLFRTWNVIPEVVDLGIFSSLDMTSGHASETLVFVTIFIVDVLEHMNICCLRKSPVIQDRHFLFHWCAQRVVAASLPE